jgi:hypothetical protein
MLARQDNGHQWRAESMQGEGRGLGLQRGPRVRGLNARRKGRGLCKEEGRGYEEGAEGGQTVRGRGFEEEEAEGGGRV